MTISKDQAEVWDRLKYGIPVLTSTVQFHGDGYATKFNSGWLSGHRITRIIVDDVEQTPIEDYTIDVNDIVFTKAPDDKSNIHVEIYTDGR